MINVSETAASKISELLVEEQKAGSGLRVFVQGGGLGLPVRHDDR
jgi:Fe-S cluster assembly iron-binding protein IscA